jgi:hypothetical protein
MTAGTAVFQRVLHRQYRPGNSAEGGAIRPSGGSLQLFSRRFGGNSASLAPATGGKGGAIYLAAGASLAYGNGNVFKGNSASGAGATATDNNDFFGAAGQATTLPPIILGVTSTNAIGTGTLSEAIYYATTGSTIQFSLPANSTITPNEELFIGGDLTIDGGSGVTLGGGAHRVFFIQQGAVTLKNLTLSGGLSQGARGGASYGGTGGGGAGMGGALFINGGAVSLVNMTISGSQALGGRGGDVINPTAAPYNFTNPDPAAAGGGGGAFFAGGAGAVGTGAGGTAGGGGNLIGESGLAENGGTAATTNRSGVGQHAGRSGGGSGGDRTPPAELARRDRRLRRRTGAPAGGPRRQCLIGWSGVLVWAAQSSCVGLLSGNTSQ